MIGAANFSDRCASRRGATPEFGGSAEAMAIAERFAKADGHLSSKARATDTKPNDGKTHRGRKPFGQGFSVTENPLAG